MIKATAILIDLLTSTPPLSTATHDARFAECQSGSFFIEWVSEDGTHVRAFGSMIGIPVSEVTIVSAPAPSKLGGAPPKTEQEQEGIQLAKGLRDISVLVTGDRLQITAEVDAEGLKKLKEVFAKYEEILKLLG